MLADANEVKEAGMKSDSKWRWVLLTRLCKLRSTPSTAVPYLGLRKKWTLQPQWSNIVLAQTVWNC